MIAKAGDKERIAKWESLRRSIVEKTEIRLAFVNSFANFLPLNELLGVWSSGGKPLAFLEADFKRHYCVRQREQAAGFQTPKSVPACSSQTRRISRQRKMITFN